MLLSEKYQVCCVFVSQNAMALFWWTAIVAARKCALPVLINLKLYCICARMLPVALTKHLGKSSWRRRTLGSAFQKCLCLDMLLHFLWTYDETEHHSRQCLVQKSCTIIVTRRGQWKRQPAYKRMDKRYPSGTWPQGPSRCPFPIVSTTLLRHAQLRAKPLSHKPLGMFQIPVITAHQSKNVLILALEIKQYIRGLGYSSRVLTEREWIWVWAQAYVSYCVAFL